ncbi:MAG: hypothetical protein FWG67_00355 [Defluviitaleaceae bacterium]|nr:hypothetical protein [Defluviitaleaceae bacterium]
MNRLKAVEQLKTIHIPDFFVQHQAEILKTLESTDIACQLLNEIERLALKVDVLQLADAEHELKYLQLSYLRSSVKSQKMKCFLQGFNEKWYFDSQSVDVTFELTAFEKLFQLARKYLDTAYRKQTFKFEFFDLDNLLMDVGAQLALLSLMSFKTHLDIGNVKLDCLYGLRLHPEFEMRAGDYQGADTVLFKLSESSGEDHEVFSN